VKRVVQTSGGTGSWATARRIADQYGTDDLVLLFADTLAEDEDLYRFLNEAAADIGVPVTRVCDGRTPEQVDVDRRWLSNSRIAQCSLELKIKPCRAWLKANCDPADTVLYVGIDWSESERVPGIIKGWAPWVVEMPLTEPPYVDKFQIDLDLVRRGIKPPRLTAQLGFPHNNCGGACVRGGQAQWVKLYRTFPDRYAAKEAHERQMRTELGSDVAILRDRTGGASKPLPLTVLRQRIEADDAGGPAALFDRDDWGGCGCLTDFGQSVAA
jgi:hypothetical protein